MSTYTEIACAHLPHYGLDGNTNIVFANPGDYNGTYALILVALLADLLSDGEPFPARIIHEGDAGYRESIGLVAKVDDAWIELEGKNFIGTDSVVMLAVLNELP